MKTIIDDESRRDHSQFDAFILFMMSHGSNGHIFGINERSVNIDNEIASVLGACPSLVNKPKLVFFQACRGL